MTTSIPPIKAFVETTYLYDMEPKKGLTACHIVGISAYKGQSLTFTILVEKAYIFSDIPPFALHQTDSEFDVELSKQSISFYNCPSGTFNIFCLDELKSKLAKAFFRKEEKWIDVTEYLYTIDFYEDNLLYHFVKLQTGHFCLVPSHKINFGNKEFLPDYKKLRHNWTV